MFLTTRFIPPELIREILGYFQPSWDWGGSSWKTRRERKPERVHAAWFLNTRLVCRTFDVVILDFFIAAVVDRNRDGSLLPDVLVHGPETGSRMAIVNRVLRRLVASCYSLAGSGDDRMERKKQKSPYQVVDFIIQIAERAVALLSDPSLTSDEVLRLREAYIDGAIAVTIGVEGAHLLGCLERNTEGLDDDDDDDFDGTSAGVLAVAAYLGRHDHIERLLAMGLDINFHRREKPIWPPLMAACLAGRLDIVEFLLERGADLRIRLDIDSSGNITVGVMEIAARGGHAHLVEFLVRSGVSADGDGHDGWYNSPLTIAAGGRHLIVLGFLLSLPAINVNCSSLEYSPLYWAIERGYEDVLVELLKRDDLDVNVTDKNNGVREVSALAVAAGLGRGDIFNTLFNHPGIDRANLRVLKCAIDGGNLNILKRIVDEVPGILLKAKQIPPRLTALNHAARNGTEEIVQYLLAVDEGESLRWGDIQLRTPLHRAILSGVLEKVQVLLRHPKMDTRCFTMADWQGQTALHYAARSPVQSPAILQLLLAHPATNINARDRNGLTPFAAAAYHGAVDMSKTLLARADVEKDSLDRFGRNPFMIAVAVGREEIIEMLLNGPVRPPQTEIWRRDNEGKTALHYAVQGDRERIAKRLLCPELGATEEMIQDALRLAGE
ncbi:ankyrin repeat-containing domain protein [Aspergillus karnatakaensis]|uniref:ankyrin repeat domain-containing protein n=1 Tax=Aspergillus karnatakaensis TaxID=1810916 RepID=UPI003CCCB555